MERRTASDGHRPPLLDPPDLQQNPAMGDLTNTPVVSARIRGTGAALPRRRVSTAELLAEAMPERDPVKLESRIGISHRHWVSDDEPAAGLAEDALRAALEDAGLEPEHLRRIVFVNSSGGDHPIPATANALCERLGLHGTCGAFDLNNACTGFVSGFDVAARMVATGESPVAVVAVEVLSRWIGPEEPRSYVVLADAAAAVILDTPEDRRAGMVSWDFGNDGRELETVKLSHGAWTGRDEKIVFGASGRDFHESALAGLVSTAEAALARGRVTLPEVDWFVVHQPNGGMLTRFLDALDVSPERTVRVVDRIGSVGAASSAYCLHALWHEKPVTDGDIVLFVGLGAGVSRGALVFRVGR